jgi:hypothetical protein
MATKAPIKDAEDEQEAKAAAGTPKLTAKNIVDEFNTSWKYIKGTYALRWKDAWSITNNQRINYGYEGTADTFIPLTFSIIESTKANVIGGRPKITFLPTEESQTADSKVLDSTIDYVWDKGHYQRRVVDWVDGALTYGTSILMETWDTKLDMPVARFIPIQDFWIDPTATSIEMAEQEGLPCGYRYLTTASALKSRQVVNPDFDDAKPESKTNQRLTNLYDHAAIDKAGEYKPTDTDAAYKNMWQGSTLGDDAETTQVEVIVRFKHDRKVEVINRKEIIYDEESDIEGMYPFAPLYDFKDPSLFYGRGHVDILKQRQEELNDVDNQDTDNMSFQLDSMKWIDPNYAHLIPEIVSGAGVVIPIPQNMMGELERPAYNPKAREKRTEIKEDMREAVGAGEVLQGVSSIQGKTATEINAEQLNAGKRFDVMIQQMETGGFQRLAKLMFKYIQKYADKELLVRSAGPKGVKFNKFLKEEYPGDWDPRVQLDASAKTEQAKAAALQGQMFMQYAQLPFINLMELAKMDMRKQYGLDDTEIEQLVGPPPGTAPAPVDEGGAAPGQPPLPLSASSALPASGGMAPLNTMAAPPAGAVPTPDPNAGGLTGDVKESADLTKLYAAAAAAGDHELMSQIVIRLGFKPSEDVPVAIATKHTSNADAKVKAALAIQDQQHKHGQALVDNSAGALDHAMRIQKHQREIETAVAPPSSGGAA